MGALGEHVRSYYRALDAGDADAIAAHFTDDAVHYYTRREPHRGANEIAENARQGVAHLCAHWAIEHLVESGEAVAIEWTMTFEHPRTRAPCLDRGAELFAFRDGRISEVRAYYHGGVPANRTGDLVGFDHGGRGYTTL